MQSSIFLLVFVGLNVDDNVLFAMWALNRVGVIMALITRFERHSVTYKCLHKNRALSMVTPTANPALIEVDLLITTWTSKRNTKRQNEFAIKCDPHCYEPQRYYYGQLHRSHQIVDRYYHHNEHGD